MILSKIKNKIKKLLRQKEDTTANDNGNVISSKAIVFQGVNLSNCNVGAYSYIGLNSILYNTEIGKFSSIGPGVIIGAGEHPTNFISTSPICYQSTTSFDIRPEKDLFYGLSDVKIGNDVWIGALCYIKNGVTIGDGAIIGVGSVILKDVEPYSIMIGTPGKLLRYRFDKNSIDELLKIKWWDWEDAVIKERLADIGSDNIGNFTNSYNVNS